MEKTTSEKIFKVILIIGIVLIFLGVSLISYEIHGAKKFCSSVEGDYLLHIRLNMVAHLCDNEEILQFSNGWDFKQNRVLELGEGYRVEFP